MSALAGVGRRFISFVKTFSHHFQSYTHDVSEKAGQYACGLMQAGARKNMDRMAEVVPDADSRNLQQFITHSKWDARKVIDPVAGEVDDLLGDPHDSCLLIDESSFAEQGRMSVGAARQWLGRLGKVDNGQVTVFGALANGHYTVPIDVRLYLPKEWTDDPGRCDKSGIPEANRIFKTKSEIAVDIVRHAENTGLCFGWVGADAVMVKIPVFSLFSKLRSQVIPVPRNSSCSAFEKLNRYALEAWYTVLSGAGV